MTDITFYNMWRTETPADRAALLAQMKDKVPALSSKAGFVAMTVLECAEDGRVLVEGRWQSKEAFDTAVADDPVAQKSRASLAQFGSPEPGLFTEVFRVSPTAIQLRSSVIAANQSLMSAGAIDSETRCPNFSRVTSSRCLKFLWSRLVASFSFMASSINCPYRTPLSRIGVARKPRLMRALFSS